MENTTFIEIKCLPNQGKPASNGKENFKAFFLVLLPLLSGTARSRAKGGGSPVPNYLQQRFYFQSSNLLGS